MKNVKCPNKNLLDWKDLVTAIGENNAYYVWDLNNGYGLDKAPNGEPSKLFSDLLSHFNGDRHAAALAKSKVYSSDFKNWFGDWLGEDKTNVSKVVDENGEPLIVYHYSSDPIEQFSIDFDNYFSTVKGGTKKAIFFTGNSNPKKDTVLDRSYKIPVYLKANRIIEKTGTKDELRATGEGFVPTINRAAEEVDAAIFHGIDDNQETNQDIYVINDPNHVKSVENNGEFSTENNDIYHKLNDVSTPFSNDHIVEDLSKLSNTKEVIDYLLKQEGIDPQTKLLLSFLQENPAKFVMSDLSPEGDFQSTVAFYDGKVNLLASQARSRSMQQIAEDVAHEMLHHYLLREYNTNPELQRQVGEIRNKYRQANSTLSQFYGMRGDESPIEFLNEFMSNSRFREALRQTSQGWFRDLINKIVAAFRKYVLGKNTITPFSRDLAQLELKVYDLLEGVNIGEVQTYSQFTFDAQRKLDTEQLKQVDRVYDNILKGLQSRLKSVKRYQQKNPRLWNELGTLISKLGNSEAEQGIQLFIDHVQDSITDAIKFLLNPIDSINAKQIRQLSQDYVGFYKPLLDDIVRLFDTTDIYKSMPNYADLQNKAYALSILMTAVNNRFNNVLIQKGKSELVSFLQSLNVPQQFIDEALLFLDNPANDTSFFTNFFGMASNSNIMITQAIANILNNVMNDTQREVTHKGLSLVKLAEAAKKKYGIDIQKSLYEKDKDGKYTGYIVRPYNYGQYMKDKREYLDNLANSLGIKKDKNGMYDLPDDDTIQKKWFDGLNKFYSDRLNRKYKSEYYSTRNKMLSIKTREALDEILDSIDAIISKYTQDGIEYTELITDSEYKQLLQLRKQKQLLANEYNLDGSMKTGDDLTIAQELKAFNEVVNGKIKYETNMDAYNKDLLKIIGMYGGDVNDPRVLKWIARNTKQRYTQAFYDRLEALLKNKPILDPAKEKLRKDLTEKRRLILQLFKNPETGLVDASLMSDQERAELLQLDRDIEATRVLVDPTTLDPNRDKFNAFAKIDYTQEYYRDYLAATNAGLVAFNDWYFKNHYENQYGTFVPASYYTFVRPKPEVESIYTETVPTGKYSKVDPSSEWFNPNFDPNGPALLLNMKYYDNSAAYNAIMSKPEVKALYDAIVDTMSEANRMIPFLNNANDGRMPLIHARLMQVLGRQSGITSRLKYLMDEVVTTQPEDLDYVLKFDTMPNGDPIKVIPTRYIDMLDDPNDISTDAVAAVISYYNMATNFRNMSNRRDDIELLLNLLKTANITDRNGTQILAKNSNIYKQAELLVDRLMYGRNKTPLNISMFGKDLNVSKLLGLVREFITKVNLSGNIWSIGTSFITDVGYTTVEAKLGRYFDGEDLGFAIREYSRRLPKMLENMGQPVPRDKVAALMLLNQVVKDNREVFSRIDLSKVLRAINNNFWYAGYTMSDYYVKSHTLMSIYHSYKLVNGEFLSKAEFINRYYTFDKKQGAVAFKLLRTTLFDAYDEDGNVIEKYKGSITNALMNRVKNRIDVMTRRVDGTLREVDKAAIHANAFGQYVVMHKNFMIQGIHDRFKKRQFNLDTGMIEEGYYRGTARFLKNVVGNRHFALKQLLADYNNLEDYELYAVRRVLFETMLFTSTTLVALSIASLVDGDDDFDNWFMQSLTYLALRSSFEFRTMYNPLEFVALIKSPTAAFTWFENASAFINLFNPFSYIGQGNPFDIIDRGVYKGVPRILRNVIKVTPIRSIIEAQDPKSKRTYLQNQLMSF